MAYGAESCTMEPGDMVVLFTDGVTEAMDVNDALYSNQRLMKMLTTKKKGSAESTVKKIVASVKKFEGDSEQTDDITVLAIEFLGIPESAQMAAKEIVIKNNVSEIAAVSEGFGAFAEELGIPMPIVMKFDLSFDELLNNVISYGYDDDEEHEIEIKMELAGTRLTITITDDGVPFNPLNMETPDTDLSIEDRDFGGMGIHLVRNLVDDASYQRRIDKNILTLVKHTDKP